MVKLLSQQFNAFRSVHKRLHRRYEGLFKIARCVKNVSYRMELPPKIKIYLIFHVGQLKPYHDDTENPTRGQSSQKHTAVVTSFNKKVEREVRGGVFNPTRSNS